MFKNNTAFALLCFLKGYIRRPLRSVSTLGFPPFPFLIALGQTKPNCLKNCPQIPDIA